MWTCLSTAPSSAVEPTTPGEGCQPVLGEWPCLSKCEEWITRDKLDFICAPVLCNFLQREPKPVKHSFGSWITTGWAVKSGIWALEMPIRKGGSGQRKQQLCRSCRKMARVEVWGREQAASGSFGTASLCVALHQRQRRRQLCGFFLEGYFDAFLQHLVFTQLCKMFQLFLGAAYVYCY